MPTDPNPKECPRCHTVDLTWSHQFQCWICGSCKFQTRDAFFLLDDPLVMPGPKEEPETETWRERPPLL